LTCSSINHFPDEYYTKDIQKRLQTILALDKKYRDQLIFTLIDKLHDYDHMKLQIMIDDLTQRLDTDLSILRNNNEMLSWDEIIELKNNGFTIGSHTQSHEFLNSNHAKHRINHELLNSRLEIEDKIKSSISAFSYPGGKISSEIKTIVRECGYKIALTQNPGINSNKENIFALKRINIWDGTVNGFGNKFSKSLFAVQLIKNSLINTSISLKHN
jgi:peptidoglycan/xylan/chitin deacetylase (PgdA/CDA1 family)